MSGTIIDTMNNVKPVEFVIEPPTLISSGFERHIDGDDGWINDRSDNWYSPYLLS